MLFVGEQAIAETTNHTLSLNAVMLDGTKTKDDSLYAGDDVDYYDWSIQTDALFGVGTGLDLTDIVDQMLDQQYGDEDNAMEALFDCAKNWEGAVPSGGWEPKESATEYCAVKGDAFWEEISIEAGSEGCAQVSYKLAGCSEIEEVTYSA